MKTRRKFQLGILFIFVLFIIVFGYSNTRDLIRPSKIMVEYPVNGSTISDSQVSIRGKAPGAKKIEIGSAKILMDAEGNFEHRVFLALGYNIIPLSSVDRFNRENTLRLELVHKPQ